VISTYQGTYRELERNRKFVLDETAKEEAKFNQTLEKGQKMISGDKIDGKTAFNLFQTFGFPPEMTREIALERGVGLTPDFAKEYDDAMHEHQEKSRTATEGKFKGGLADASYETTRLHTSAHLLLEALRRVLGDHVIQKGSNITADRLRFDFSHPDKLTDEQKKQVEHLVNGAINSDLPVSYQEMPLDDAKKIGAMGVFESKYGEKVKVYTVGEGDNIFSREICGGPHVKRTSELGRFRIKKEQSSSAGVRRIKAVLD
jgi:alanyl-tRNA synthetase